MPDQKMRMHTSIEATIIRKDGTKVPLGKIHDDRWWWKFGPKQLVWLRIKRANRSVHGNQGR